MCIRDSYGIGRVWANAWDVFHRMPYRVARGGRDAVDFVLCLGWGGPFRDFFFRFFFFERTRLAASMSPPCLIYLSTSTEARPRERSDRGRFFSFRVKKPLQTGVRTGCHYFIGLSVRLSVCASACLCICPCVCNIRHFY